MKNLIKIILNYIHWICLNFKNILFSFHVIKSKVILKSVTALNICKEIQKIKGLSIESLLWGNGDGALKVFGIEGDWDNLLGPPYPKIGGGRIYSGFSRACGPPLTFAPLYMLGLEPETCGEETGRWGVDQGDIVLSPTKKLVCFIN